MMAINILYKTDQQETACKTKKQGRPGLEEKFCNETTKSPNTAM